MRVGAAAALCCSAPPSPGCIRTLYPRTHCSLSERHHLTHLSECGTDTLCVPLMPQVTTEEECEAAFLSAVAMPDKAVLIECVVDKDDCSVEVLQLGKLMANRNNK